MTAAQPVPPQDDDDAPDGSALLGLAVAFGLLLAGGLLVILIAVSIAAYIATR